MIYEYKCPSCHKTKTLKRPVEARNDPCQCGCGEGMALKISGGSGFTPVLGGGGFQGYRCPVTDQWVHSKRQRRRIMDEHGLVEKG